MRVVDREQALKDSRFLHRLPTPVAAALRARCQMREYDQNEVLHRTGDIIPGLCILEHGLIADYCLDESPPARQRALIQWSPQLCVLSASGETEWPVLSVALVPSLWAIFSRDAYEEFKREQAPLFTGLVEALARQIYVAHTWAARLSSATLRPRLRLILHRMAEELGTPHEGGVLLDFYVTHDMLATIARATRDEVGRAFRDLKREGLITRRPGRRVWVPDPGRLIEDRHD